MKLLLVLGPFAALLRFKVSASEPVCDDEASETGPNSRHDNALQVGYELECGVYMAPSTIGEANLGIYTGKPLKKDDIVNYPEIAIPLLFREWGYHGNNPDGSLWDRYIWDGPVAKIEPKFNELDRAGSGAVFIPGVGCTVNSRLDMSNIHSAHGSVYDTAGLHRSNDPGSGAFTPYHSTRTVAKCDIEPGTELFAAYGDNWIPEIPGAVVTFDRNMDDADEFLEDFAEFSQQNDFPEDVMEALWNLTSREFPYESHILGALPPASWSAVEAALRKRTEESSISRHFVRETSTRDLGWLKREGKCQDHLRPGHSTLAQAGRGAFAARDLPKGSVVGYAPLIHMGDNRELWQIEYTGPDGINYTKQDLIINYSFGHRDSTLLLTPYGAMVNYINHHQKKANVKVQWPVKELLAHKPDWLSKDLEYLKNVHEKIGLSFDYIALRDIKVGEEIFMDYGIEWEEAWNKHLTSWRPPQGSDSYLHSSQWTEHLKTEAEQLAEPYPVNLVTLCVPSYKSDGQTGYKFMRPLNRRDNEPPRYVFCQVRDRTVGDEGNVTYTVFLPESGITMKGVDNSGILLTDTVRSADWHLKSSFRHEIMVPDDVFPKAWRNR